MQGCVLPDLLVMETGGGCGEKGSVCLLPGIWKLVLHLQGYSLHVSPMFLEFCYVLEFWRGSLEKALLTWRGNGFRCCAAWINSWRPFLPGLTHGEPMSDCVQTMETVALHQLLPNTCQMIFQQWQREAQDSWECNLSCSFSPRRRNLSFREIFLAISSAVRLCALI